MKLTLIPSEHVTKVWGNVSGLLERAVDIPCQRHDVVDLLEACISGKQALWVLFDDENDNEIVGALTTSIQVYPRFSALAIPYVGGRMFIKHGDLIMDVLMRFARDSGLSHIEGYGRDGWLRAGKKWGIAKSFTVYTIDLNEEAQMAAE